MKTQEIIKLLYEFSNDIEEMLSLVDTFNKAFYKSAENDSFNNLFSLIKIISKKTDSLKIKNEEFFEKIYRLL